MATGSREDQKMREQKMMDKEKLYGGQDNFNTENGGVIKPWSNAKGKFVVQPPSRSTLRNKANRIDQMKKMKVAAVKGLDRAPYVPICFKQGKQVGPRQGALLDTGSVWSLLDKSQLTQQEVRSLSATERKGNGVSGEEINIIGETWRSLHLGGPDGPIIKNQRFVVVDKMITPIILGIDFWGRLPPFTLSNDQLEIEELNLMTQLFSSFRIPVSKEETSGRSCMVVRLTSDSVIPARSQAILRGKADSMVTGKEYLIEPLAESEDMMARAAYCMIEGTDAEIPVRIANVAEKPYTLKKGEVISTVTDDATSSRTNAGRAFCGGNASKKWIWRTQMGKQLTEKQKCDLECLLEPYEEVFYSGGSLPAVKIGVEHMLRIPEGTAPKAFRPRRLSRDLTKEVHAEIQQLKEMGVIRDSNSPWAAPIVCARRANGKLRLAIDYRGLNAVSAPATLHPIPVIDDLIDRLAKAKYFTVLDAKSGYHQMPLKAEDVEASAFVTPWGQYEWAERTPFGLKGAGYSFQRLMSAVLGSSNFNEALCYLDDILVWGDDWKEHTDRLRKVMEKVKKAGLTLSFSKCKFGVSEVEYLGCIVRNGMLCLSEQRVRQLRGIKEPENVRELRRALGAFAYVQRWLPGLAEVAKPLYDAVTVKPYSRLEWSSEMSRSFQTIKDMIANATALNIPDQTRRFTLVTDCSDRAAGAMLAQVNEENPQILCPVAYFHHTLTKAEERYTTTEKELLAMYLAIKKYRIYLTGQFDLITDHQALRWLKSLDPHDEKGRRGRWLDFLQQFDFVVTHKAGKSPELSMADFLSRVTTDGSCAEEFRPNNVAAMNQRSEGEIPPEELFDIREVISEQRNDPVLQEIHQRLLLRDGDIEVMELPRLSNDQRNELAKVLKVKDRLFMDMKGAIRLKFNGGRRTAVAQFGRKVINRLVVPLNSRKAVLKLNHDSPVAGHMGMLRSWQRIRNCFWWPGMKEDVEQYIAQCDLCGKNKHSNRQPKAPIQQTDIPTLPLERLQVDFVGPFSAARTHDYRWALQIQDVFSRFLIFVPCKDSTALTAATAVMDNWLCVMATFPRVITSDHGKHFSAQVFETMCQLSGIEHHMGAPGHAESQGQVERQNQLLNQVKCLCDNNIELWPEALLRIQYCHNISINSATQMAPASLVLGQEILRPEEFLTEEDKNTGDNAGKETSATETMKRKENELWEAIEKARENIVKTQEDRCERMNGGRTSEQLEVEQEVRYKLSDRDIANLGGKKIAPRNSDRYIITNKLGNGWTYRISPKDGSAGLPKTRHFNDLIHQRTSTQITNTGDDELEETESLENITEQDDRTETSRETEDDGNISTNARDRLRRVTQPPSRLQVGSNQKKYDESRHVMKDTDSASDSEDAH